MPKKESVRSTAPVRTDRIPPHNSDAEVSVLGSLLIDKESIIKVADFLREADFYSRAHASIYGAIFGLYEQREPIDILSVANKLKENGLLDEAGGDQYLASLSAAVQSSGHVEHYAKIVQKAATRRRLIRAGGDITELAFADNDDIQQVLDDAQRKIFEVTQTQLKKSFIPIGSLIPQVFARIEQLQSGDGSLKGLSSGFDPLDNVLSGMQPSDLIILAARPSVGKTSIALDIVRHVAVRQHVPVGIFSLEMSATQLTDRLLCAEADIDLIKMRTGRLSDQGDEFERMNNAMAALSEAPIYIDDSAASNIMEIRTLARRLQAEHGIGFLVIDYLQLMQGDAREGRVQEVSQISRALKGLARELNIPILALSQLSRAVESRTPPVPKLSDLRESGSIEQDADVVLFLYPRGRFEKNAESEQIVDLIIAKHRNGPTGVLSLYFRQESASFASIDFNHAYAEAQKQM